MHKQFYFHFLIDEHMNIWRIVRYKIRAAIEM